VCSVRYVGIKIALKAKTVLLLNRGLNLVMMTLKQLRISSWLASSHVKRQAGRNYDLCKKVGVQKNRNCFCIEI